MPRKPNKPGDDSLTPGDNNSPENRGNHEPEKADALPINQPDAGDAHEPENATGSPTFNPADFESSPQQDVKAGSDPFDPESLRLGQDFNASMGVEKALLYLPHRKPEKSWFVRVHPDPAYRLQTAVIELKEDRGAETYLVTRPLWGELAGEPTFRPKLLVTAVNRQGTLFLWEANLPQSDGREDKWSATMLDAIKLASERWVRVAANMALGAYDVWTATGQLPEPGWPSTPFPELLRLSFKDRIITNLNHPVLRRLRGEV